MIHSNDTNTSPQTDSGSGRLYTDILKVLSQILELDEGTKAGHARRVGILSYNIASHMGLGNVGDIYTAALLHDIGSIGLSERAVHLLETGDDTEAVHAHPEIGGKILGPAQIFAPTISLIADHHERMDGLGYPSGKSRQDIAVGSSIILLADTLDIALRLEPSLERQALARQVATAHAGTAWPKHCADAARACFDAQPELLDGIFDDERLEVLIGEVTVAPSNLNDFSRVDLLSQLLWVLARAVDAKHKTAMGHTIRTAYYALQISRAVASDEISSWDVIWAGLLHDVGKIGTPRGLLNKSEPLTAQEWETVELHAADSFSIVSEIHDLAYLAHAAASHHERYDGRGYPRGSAGEQIPLLGRILAYADVFDALTSERSYRQPLTAAEGIGRMRQIVGSHLDPHIAEAALGVLEECGGRVLALPATMDGFYRFFDADDANIARLFEQENKGEVSSRPTRDGGITLVEYNHWARVRFSENLECVSGTHALKVLAQGFGDVLSGEKLEDALRGFIAENRAELDAQGSFAHYLFITGVTPFDVLLVGAEYEEGSLNSPCIDVHIRSASDKFMSMERMALLYRNFFSTSDAVFFTDPSAVIIDVNNTFTEMFGYRLDYVVGKHPKFLLPESLDSEMLERAFDAMGTAQFGVWEGETDTITYTGGSVPVQFTFMSVQDATGVVAGYVGRLRDISERLSLETAVRERNDELEALNQTKNDLIAITSHDLKSPITAVMSYAGLLKLKRDHLTPPDIERYANLIIASGDRMVSFINDMLDIDKIESGRLEPQFEQTDVIAILQRSLDNSVSTGLMRKINVILESESESAKMMIDDLRMEQVFNNIISNAVKFSPDEGTVRIRFHIENKRSVQISVEDEGDGIPESDLDLIFDRYYQAKQCGRVARTSGAGLGLNIANKIIELHGGTITAENRAPKGCRMRISLPLNRLVQ